MTYDPTVPSSEIKTITPIPFWQTRSFWLGWFPALLTLVDQVVNMFLVGAGGPFADFFVMVGNLFGAGWTPESVSNFMLMIAPIYALVVGHQRRGVNQPYTTSATTNEVITVITEGKQAFDRGKTIGAQLKNKF